MCLEVMDVVARYAIPHIIQELERFESVSLLLLVVVACSSVAFLAEYRSVEWAVRISPGDVVEFEPSGALSVLSAFPALPAVAEQFPSRGRERIRQFHTLCQPLL